MPCIKDESTVNKIAEIFTSNGRNKTKALLEVGYTEKYSNFHGTTVVFSNSRVKQAIARIDAAARAETGWDADTALKELRERLAYVKRAAEEGNTTAVTVQLQILREINDIMGLHKQRVVQEQAEERALTATEQVEARRIAALRLYEGQERA